MVVLKMVNVINVIFVFLVIVVVGVVVGEILLICCWKGVMGNSIDMCGMYYVDDLVLFGVGLMIMLFFGGVVNLDIMLVIFVIKGIVLIEYVMLYIDSMNMGILEEELNCCWEFDNMKDGQVVIVVCGIEGEVFVWLLLCNSLMCYMICVMCDLINLWEIVVVVVVVIESYCVIDLVLLFMGVVLIGYVVVWLEDDWEVEQCNNMFVVGGFVLELMEDGIVNILCMVMNYMKNLGGVDDKSWCNLNWVKMFLYFCWFIVNVFQMCYCGYKLVEYMVDLIFGQKIMIVVLGIDIMFNNYEQFILVGLFQNMEYYKQMMQVEVDGMNGKLKIIDQFVFVMQYYQMEIMSEFVVGYV